LWPDREKSIGVLAVALTGLGIALFVGPSLFIQMTDDHLNRIQRAEVRRWMQTHVRQGNVADHTTAAVIEPGRDGYLLEIPKIGVQAVVHELEPEVFSGANTPTLKLYGVGQLPFTSDLRNVSPGQEGTAVITGHRTTSGAPFRHINQLGPGDVIIVRRGTLEQRWAVVYSTTAVPSQLDAIRSFSGARRLVILACNPPFSAKERLIVYSRLVLERAQGGQN
jgi:LPXTG-site transpeptidase (sortase) family protein